MIKEMKNWELTLHFLYKSVTIIFYVNNENEDKKQFLKLSKKENEQI